MRFSKSFSLVIFLVFVSQNLFAQTATQADSSGTTSTTLQEVTSPLANPKLIAGWKSYNDSGRLNQLQDPKSRDLKSKNEMFLGFRSELGYELFGQIVETGKYYGDTAPLRTKVAPDDPSLSIRHPIYKDTSLKIDGVLREYFPVTDFSISRNLYEQSYYLTLTYQMASKWVLWNQLIPRYFSQTNYKATDTTFYTEDYTTLTRKVNDWFRVGLGQHSQLEYHNATATGYCVEVYPLADLMLSDKIFAGPRVYFPVAAQNAVFEGPAQVSAQNIYGEFYLQAYY